MQTPVSPTKLPFQKLQTITRTQGHSDLILGFDQGFPRLIFYFHGLFPSPKTTITRRAFWSVSESFQIQTALVVWTWKKLVFLAKRGARSLEQNESVVHNSTRIDIQSFLQTLHQMSQQKDKQTNPLHFLSLSQLAIRKIPMPSPKRFVPPRRFRKTNEETFLKPFIGWDTIVWCWGMIVDD